MSATLHELTTLTTTYSPVETLAFLTGAVVISLMLIGLSFRFYQTMSSLQKYEEATERVKQIEDKLEEMKARMAAAELEYQKSIAELNQTHSRECFNLQQIVFERNSEIIELKNQMLKFNVTRPI